MTPKQWAILEFIRSKIAETGTAPEYSEIRIRCHLANDNAVAGNINRLIERGFLTREHDGELKVA